MYILNQKCHPHTGKLDSETPGDSLDAFLRWGDVLVYYGCHNIKIQHEPLGIEEQMPGRQPSSSAMLCAQNAFDICICS